MQDSQKQKLSSRAIKNKKISYLEREGEIQDPHAGLTMQQKLAMRPEELVPQLGP